MTTTSEETDLQYLADIFGRRGQDWIVRAIGARALVKTDVERTVKDRRQHLDRWGRTTRTGVDEPLRQVIANYQLTLDELEQTATARPFVLAGEPAAVVEQVRRWIADLETVIALKRGQGLGAESKTFDLIDRQKLLKDIVRMLTGEPFKR
jgi:alkanesulfonate monooxygenase SsuD/methylene tetrahydromethanopterin reductase-like flavin-dependent oxidoreductase (luciferase family)